MVDTAGLSCVAAQNGMRSTIAARLHDISLSTTPWLKGGAAARALRGELLRAYAASPVMYSVGVKASVGVDGSWVEEQLGGTHAAWGMGEGWGPDPGRGFSSASGGSGGMVEVSVSTGAAQGVGSRWQGGAAVFGRDTSVAGAISSAHTAVHEADFRARAMVFDAVGQPAETGRGVQHVTSLVQQFSAAGCGAVVLGVLASADATMLRTTLSACGGHAPTLGLRLDPGLEGDQLLRMVEVGLQGGVSLFDSCAAGVEAPTPTSLLISIAAARRSTGEEAEEAVMLQGKAHLKTAERIAKQLKQHGWLD